jgi:putative intracellular protease/amidase
MKAVRCLLITTSNNKLGDSLNRTGVWMEGLAAPYFVLRDAGEYITLASPKGGPIPLDPNSRSAWGATEHTRRFKRDAQAMYRFAHALPLKEIRAENFDLAFVAGGYGAMWDFPDNEELKHLLEDLMKQGKPVGLVGHGVVALISLMKSNGEPLVKGRGVTAFTNREEDRSGLDERPPFLLESKLISLGALFTSGADFSSYVVVDENMITGQNPASSGETATRLLEGVHTRKTNGQVRVKPAII